MSISDIVSGILAGTISLTLVVTPLSSTYGQEVATSAAQEVVLDDSSLEDIMTLVQGFFDHKMLRRDYIDDLMEPINYALDNPIMRRLLLSQANSHLQQYDVGDEVDLKYQAINSLAYNLAYQFWEDNLSETEKAEFNDRLKDYYDKVLQTRFELEEKADIIGAFENPIDKYAFIGTIIEKNGLEELTLFSLMEDFYDVCLDNEEDFEDLAFGPVAFAYFFSREITTKTVSLDYFNMFGDEDWEIRRKNAIIEQNFESINYILPGLKEFYRGLFDETLFEE
ncbi:hypothetical protein HQ533_00040 [Candidatus Woesearchaeota archaeon]|nr:hypothetical protein [Candidatus Woesearchaeota archaeon]